MVLQKGEGVGLRIAKKLLQIQFNMFEGSMIHWAA